MTTLNHLGIANLFEVSADLELVSKIGSASNQALTLEVV
jgi:hypothetical protein